METLYEKYLGILKREIVPAVGCTEPVAAALAVARAKEALGEAPQLVTLHVSRNIYKNAMGVGVPGTGMVGLEIAAALAAYAGNSAYRLEVLKNADEAAYTAARRMLDEKKVRVFVKETPEKLYIEAVCEAGKETASAVIKNVHTNICLVTKNGKALFEGDEQRPVCEERTSPSYWMDVREIYEFITSVPDPDLSFIQDGIEMNWAMANEGIRRRYGIGVGKQLYDELASSGGAGHDVTTYAIALTAAASDARMAGCTLPVMSTAGSGNQGLTATLPVAAVAAALETEECKTRRAVALSELITIYVKTYIGKLSALCGCAIAASVGAACGITYLKGGGYENLVYAIKNMIADITGLICDGAKSSCSLKIATAVGSAMRCSSLALAGSVISDKDGIIENSLERTVENLGKLANDGMAYTDRVILDMMLCKQTV